MRTRADRSIGPHCFPPVKRAAVQRAHDNMRPVANRGDKRGTNRALKNARDDEMDGSNAWRNGAPWVGSGPL
jgi:hypothetical protein